MKKNILLASMMLLGSSWAMAQLNDGGTLPVSLEYPQFPKTLTTIQAPALDMSSISKQDEANAKQGGMYRVGRVVPVRINPATAGTWQTLRNGDRVWRVRIEAKGAKAMSLYFSRFRLPKGARMHVYNDDRSHIIGGFTALNNHESNLFSTEYVRGEAIIVEYYEPVYAKGQSDFIIEEVGHAYKNALDFGDSGSCQVNVNCSEGTGKTQQRDAVARVLVRVGSVQGWCSGTMVNNVRQNCTPYYLTAMHCSLDGSTLASAANLNQWIFYFNYQASGCSTPASAPTSNTLTGAARVAHSNDGGGNSGSDFLLLQLNSNPQSSWNVFFAGWNRNNTPTTGGYGIHHPAGDIKKVSTFTGSTNSTSWGGSVSNTHWGVTWIATTNGHGTTEGGSSGSALFNSNGQLIGTLTGGGSSCVNLNAGDSYGKLSYHWNSNGTTSALRVKDWLDPDNTGAVTLAGLYYPCAIINDASITNITNPANGQYICSNPFAPVVVMRNAGSTVLTSATINYQINNNTPSTYAWTGNLAAGSSITLTLPTVSVTPNAAFQLTIYTTAPNGTADAVPANDTARAISQYDTPYGLPYSEALNAGAIPADLDVYNPTADSFAWKYANGVSAFGTGTGSLVFDNYNSNNGTNPGGTADWVFLPKMNFTGITRPVLTFDVAYARFDATSSDSLAVVAATNCATSYSSIFYSGGTALSTNGGTDLNTMFTPTAAQWVTKTVDLSAYGNMNNVSLAFVNVSGYGNRLFIDNINVRNACTITVSTASTTNIACFGATTGAATLNVAGGTAPYSYAWSNGRTTATATGLAANAYSITVTDALGCTASHTLTLTQPASALSLTTSAQTNITCFGNNTGAFIITATGGTAPYTFNRGTGSQSSGAFSNLTAGAYTTTVTDANGCVANRTVTITQPSAALTSSIASQTNISCFGNTGAFTITATGGTSPYTFNRGTGSQSSGAFSNLAAGSYTVTITDNNGCSTTRSITLTQPASALSTTVANQTNIACFGSNTGAFTITAAGGTSPYTFNRGTGSQSSGAFSNLAAGSYNVTITDANGCSNTRSITLTQPTSGLVASLSATASTCAGNDGTATATVSGGTTPYSFAWSNGANTSALNGVAAGTYRVTITDANGCSNTNSILVPNGCAASCTVSVTGSSTAESCVNQCNGTATAMASGGTAPYVYTWSNSTSNATTITSLCGGIYTVVAADAMGCSDTLNIMVQNATPINASASVQTPSCATSGNGSATAMASGGTAPYAYRWSNGVTTATINNVGFGIYSFTVTDANGCTSLNNVTITSPQALTTTVSGTAPSTSTSSDGTATAMASGGTAPYSFAWSNGAGGSTIGGLTAGVYTVTVTDAHGCTTQASVTIGLTSVQESSNTVQSFVVYPNPSTGAFTIQIDLASTEEVSIQLIDVLGRELRQMNTTAQSVTIPMDIAEQASGVYFVVLRTQQHVITRKISISRD